MIHRNQLVLNSPQWSHTGRPVRDMVQLETASGLVVNCPVTNERPLPLPRCCRNDASLPSFDRLGGGPAGVRADGNYRDQEFGLDLGVVPDRFGVFGSTPRAEDRNEDTFDDVGDPDSEVMRKRRAALRRMLGIEDIEENPERVRSRTKTAVDDGIRDDARTPEQVENAFWDRLTIPGCPTRSPLE